MRVEVLTIFPELFWPFLTRGMVERARRARRLEVRLTDLRDFTGDRHRSVDDRPYGGGPGMLIKPEPVFRALETLQVTAADRLVLMCPSGARLTQGMLQDFTSVERAVVLCGRYEGFDQRILDAWAWNRVSLGDYVLSGGEVPAMALIEGIARLLPGVLGHGESARRDSFSEWAGEDGLDHPHFTRPPLYRGLGVPEVLLSGNHGEIEQWRRSQASAATSRRSLKRLEQ
ncbi:MAG: tRNA (guanosine(37)-N1)-methyltransferase TrmD [Planctomycetota bacterium]